MRLLIVSNGHGEDIIGAALAEELRHLGYEVQAVPLVGRGLVYERVGFPVLGPRQEMPSGGFTIRSLAVFWADLKAGWVSMSLAHYRAVRQAAQGVSATLVVGDIYGLLVGSVFSKRPLFQIQCLSSVRAWDGRHGRPYSVLERLLMRWVVRVYPREEEAAAWLRAHGIANVAYLGNPMLDALEFPRGQEGDGLALPPPYLLLLPGSRSDAYESLPKMLEATRYLRASGLTPVVVWAGRPLDPQTLGEGWRMEVNEPGVPIRLLHPDGTTVYLALNAFKAAVLGASVAISTSGTAAEQAAGYGVPLVGFPTSGPQYTPAFARRQQRLLGEALLLVEAHPQAIAEGVQRWLADSSLRQAVQVAGKAAMGEPGAAQRIALDIHQQLQAKRGPL